MKIAQITGLIAVLFSCSASGVDENRSDRPLNVSHEAFRVEGSNKDYWYLVHSVHDHKNSAFISVYDNAGGLIIKKKFHVICRLVKPIIWLENIQQQISGFDGKRILLKSTAANEVCWME